MTPLLSIADDRPEHYSGENAETLQEALENLQEDSRVFLEKTRMLLQRMPTE